LLKSALRYQCFKAHFCTKHFANENKHFVYLKDDILGPLLQSNNCKKVNISLLINYLIKHTSEG